MKQCKYCGKEFVPEHNRQKYCSKECQRKRNNEKLNSERSMEYKEFCSVIHNCAVCGNEFKPYSTRQKYCSQDCLTNAQRKIKADKVKKRGYKEIL